ncbi:MAG: DMT family transporter [Lachnospiraceae bacterium]|nr:DMT family transporter [Lachnospiraceae bacterium]
MKSTHSRWFGSGILLLTAFIWGMAFTAQSAGMDYIGPFTMNCARSILGGLALLPLIAWNQARQRKKAETGTDTNWRATVIGGICCGVILAVASALQQIGIIYTTVGKAGFITTLYIVMVPLVGVFWRKKIAGRVWFSVALAAVGMYLLCMNESFTVNPGDMYVFFCAVAFTGHILVIDHFSPKADGVAMSCIQFFTCAVLSGIAMLVAETPTWENIFAAAVPILYAGIMSSGVGYTLQIIGQKYTEPTVASLIMSLESVFAVLGGWMILGEKLSGRELLGCAVVFVGIILVQLPERRRARSAKE